jgi:hypothetical protein
MSLRFSIVVGLASVALAACASSGAIRAANEARYSGPRGAMLEVVAETVVAAKYRVRSVDAARGRLVTVDISGLLHGSEERDASGHVAFSAVSVRYQISLVRSADGYRVEITPIMWLIENGYPAPIPLAPDDPQTPNWVVGRTEKLTLAIYEALAPYRVDPTMTASAAQ